MRTAKGTGDVTTDILLRRRGNSGQNYIPALKKKIHLLLEKTPNHLGKFKWHYYGQYLLCYDAETENINLKQISHEKYRRKQLFVSVVKFMLLYNLLVQNMLIFKDG